MWYPVSDGVAEEPASLDAARDHLGTNPDEDDGRIWLLISAARAHVEAYCNRLFATHQMDWACDGFADFVRLPAAPVASIASISFVDLSGNSQDLAESVFILRADGLDPKIALRPGQFWPQIQPGSRITVTGIFGGSCPEDVQRAMLLLIGEGDLVRENAAQPLWSTVDILLSNHRRGAW